MGHELFYTSHRVGLTPGAHGFCTVAMTRGLPPPLAERLEALSAYRPLYGALDDRNPVSLAHSRLSLGGHDWHVLSRVGAAGLDYTDRTNKFAHHIALAGGELPRGGPAWLLDQPGFLESEWDGRVHWLSAGRAVPTGDTVAGVCQTWADLTGDAGWAGVLLEAFERDPARPAWLVVDPAQPVLPLFAEALALLPPARRWAVTFNTYFCGGAPEGTWTWRAVPTQSTEAQAARKLRGALVLDLTARLGPASGGRLVELARGRGAPAAADRPVQSPVSVWARAESPQPATIADLPEPATIGCPRPVVRAAPTPAGPSRAVWFLLGLALGLFLMLIPLGVLAALAGPQLFAGAQPPATTTATPPATPDAAQDLRRLEDQIKKLEREHSTAQADAAKARASENRAWQWVQELMQWVQPPRSARLTPGWLEWVGDLLLRVQGLLTEHRRLKANRAAESPAPANVRPGDGPKVKQVEAGAPMTEAAPTPNTSSHKSPPYFSIPHPGIDIDVDVAKEWGIQVAGDAKPELSDKLIESGKWKGWSIQPATNDRTVRVVQSTKTLATIELVDGRLTLRKEASGPTVDVLGKYLSRCVLILTDATGRRHLIPCAAPAELKPARDLKSTPNPLAQGGVIETATWPLRGLDYIGADELAFDETVDVKIGAVAVRLRLDANRNLVGNHSDGTVSREIRISLTRGAIQVQVESRSSGKPPAAVGRLEVDAKSPIWLFRRTLGGRFVVGRIYTTF